MGCSWKKKDGQTLRVGKVTAPRVASSVSVASVAGLMRSMGIDVLAFSPVRTVEDLEAGTVRIWLDPELGHIAETRISPSSPPQRHFITPLEALSIEALRPSIELLGRIMHPAIELDVYN